MVSPMDEDEIRRRRSFEMIDRANACLSEPRDLEAKHRAQQWIEEAHARQREERAPPPKPAPPTITKAQLDELAKQTRQQIDAAVAELDARVNQALKALAAEIIELLRQEAREAQEAHAMTNTRLQVEVMAARERIEKLERLTEEPKAAHPQQLRVIG
jgi:tRNA U34 5-carboxymethylaminomethyl modifying GTPase MnmE/TrmE